MPTVVVAAENLEQVRLPAKCAACGADLPKGTTPQWPVRIRKGLRALFVRRKPKAIDTPLCHKCVFSLSQSNFLACSAIAEVIEKLGGILAVCAIGGIIWLDHASSFPLGPRVRQGGYACGGLAGLLVWVGWVIRRAARRREERRVGIRCTRVRKNRWEFRFRLASYADGFVLANADRVVGQ